MLVLCSSLCLVPSVPACSATGISSGMPPKEEEDRTSVAPMSLADLTAWPATEARPGIVEGNFQSNLGAPVLELTEDSQA